jgi:hypothetical protein
MSSRPATDAMDEATRLVAELQSKLSELDFKVWQYRKEMLDEFDRYAVGVLKGLPRDIMERVSKTIAGDIKNYKGLTPNEAETHEAIPTGTSDLANDSESAAPSYFTTPTSHIRADGSMDSPRSPHEREVEFQGVFTPSYLPLLDSSHRNERSSTPERTERTSPAFNKGKESEREMSSPGVDASTDTRSLAPSPELQRPSTPKRRNTDELSVASAVSDQSDGPIRRSALRRTSSAHQGQSPRRVRFEFQGSEVLPSASPQPMDFIQPPETSGLSYSSDEEGDSEQQIENIDPSPPPKRISSSQRLRLLSHEPLEEGTQWTTVSAPEDGSGSIEGANADSDSADEEGPNGSQFPPDMTSAPTPIRNASIPLAEDTENDDETLSDDDILDMPPLRRSSKSEVSTSSPMDIPALDETVTPTTSTRTPNKTITLGSPVEMGDAGEFEGGTEQDEFDELFSFDESMDRGEKKRPTPVRKEPVESEPEVDLTRDIGFDELSRSPPISVPARRPTPPIEAPYNGIVGSYKGRPFTMPIVSDDIHAQAASLGNMNSFVGSVDGRSGLDESDFQSFRQSLRNGSLVASSFNGQPRSLSERLMMDEMREAEDAKNHA